MSVITRSDLDKQVEKNRKFYDKYEGREEIKGITFHAVSNIEQLLEQIIEKDIE